MCLPLHLDRFAAFAWFVAVLRAGWTSFRCVVLSWPRNQTTATRRSPTHELTQALPHLKRSTAPRSSWMLLLHDVSATGFQERRFHSSECCTTHRCSSKVQRLRPRLQANNLGKSNGSSNTVMNHMCHKWNTGV